MSHLDFTQKIKLFAFDKRRVKEQISFKNKFTCFSPFLSLLFNSLYNVDENDTYSLIKICYTTVIKPCCKLFFLFWKEAREIYTDSLVNVGLGIFFVKIFSNKGQQKPSQLYFPITVEQLFVWNGNPSSIYPF